MIRGIRVVCRTDNGDQDIKLRIDGEPDALFFKQAHRSSLSASICGVCGFIEFFAEDPGELYSAYTQSHH